MISDVFDWQRDETALHPNQKPVASMAAILHAYCAPNGLVLDPFMGSGSTGIAAVTTGRRFLRMEIERQYVDVARTRIADSLRTHRKSAHCA